MYTYTYIHTCILHFFTSTLVGADEGAAEGEKGRGRRRKEGEVRGRPLTEATRRAGARKRSEAGHQQSSSPSRRVGSPARHRQGRGVGAGRRRWPRSRQPGCGTRSQRA